METNIKYRARHDYLIVKCETVNNSRGGVALPDVAAESKRWRVVGKGPDCQKSVVVGDTVVVGGVVEMGKNDALLYQIPGVADLYLVKDKNIIAVVEG